MLTGKPRRVAIVAASRTPFARSGTAYAKLSNKTMLTDTLRGLVEKCRLEGVRLGEVAGGAVMKHASDWNLVRECVLGSGLDPRTPAYDVQQACGTGLEATILVANKIALGQIDCGIATWATLAWTSAYPWSTSTSCAATRKRSSASSPAAWPPWPRCAR